MIRWRDFPPGTWILLGAAAVLIGLFVAVIGNKACLEPARAQVKKVDNTLSETAVRIAPIQRVNWIAECSEMPADTVEGIEVLAVVRRPGMVGALLKKNSRRGWLIGHKLGSREAGWYVFSITGPEPMMTRMKSSPACRVVMTWKEAWANLGAAAKQWLAERSTCCGEMTHRGRTFHSWPCRWEIDRAGEINIVNRTGIGPGITTGGDPCAVIGGP